MKLYGSQSGKASCGWDTILGAALGSLSIVVVMFRVIVTMAGLLVKELEKIKGDGEREDEKKGDGKTEDCGAGHYEEKGFKNGRRVRESAKMFVREMNIGWG